MKRSWLTSEFRNGLVILSFLGCLFNRGLSGFDLALCVSLVANAFLLARTLFKLYRGMDYRAEKTGEFYASILQFILFTALYFNGKLGLRETAYFIVAAYVAYAVCRGFVKKRQEVKTNVLFR